MKQLSIKKIIDFRRKQDRGKNNFVKSLKINKSKDDDGGGDYWISCLSAISNSFKEDRLKPIIDKRIRLEEKYEKTEYKRTKDMYKRNIDILYNYEDFDLKKWKPSKQIFTLRKNKTDSVLAIKGLQVLATPHHVFTFKKNGIEEIGAIWFVAKLNGFMKEELGMFADVLYRYLKIHFSNEYSINPKWCIAVDVFNNFEINYSQLQDEAIPKILNRTLDEIKSLI